MTTGKRFTIPAPSTAELPAALARRVHLRDRRACVYCGANNVPVEVDHVRSRAQFPASAPAAKVNAPSNLVTACAPCNQVKGPQGLRGFAETLRLRGMPPRLVTALVRRARAAVRRELPFAVVP